MAKKKTKAAAPANQLEHRLQIVSLRNLEALCSCGTWDLKRTVKPEDTDKILRKLAMEAHGAHVRRAKQRK